jgi:hypothetical protein
VEVVGAGDTGCRAAASCTGIQVFVEQGLGMKAAKRESGAKHRRIVAFAHIGKTGGTTLIHVLRRNFGLRAVDVRPLHASSEGVFSSADMKTMLRTNPWVECISGHSVRCYSDLRREFPEVLYVTLLRNPLERYVSQYLQRIQKHGFISMEEFLERRQYHNVQTRFLAGEEDLGAALENLSEKMSVVGTVEQFDGFLEDLRRELKLERFDSRFRVLRRTSAGEKKRALLDRYANELAEVNALDRELYEFARTRLSASENFAQEGERSAEGGFRYRGGRVSRTGAMELADYVLRKFYYQPITSVVRKFNGLPMTGLR